MAKPGGRGVFLCQCGESTSHSIEMKNLFWTAKAAGGTRAAATVPRACAQEGAERIVRRVLDDGLASFILAACPLAGAGGILHAKLLDAGLDLGMMTLVDICAKPEAGTGPCRVKRRAERDLRQALAGGEPARGYEPFEGEVHSRVLVLGDSLTALTAARGLARDGKPVLLVTPGRRLFSDPLGLVDQESGELEALLKEIEELAAVETVRGGKLLELSGSAGSFLARVHKPGGEIGRYPVGAVLAAQAPPGVLNARGLDLPAERVLSLSEMVALLGSPAHLQKMLGGRAKPRVAFLIGLGAESAPDDLRAVLRAGRMLKERLDGEAVLFVGNSKVAASDLEAAAQEARSNGLLTVRLTRPDLRFSLGEETVAIECRDEALGREVRQEFDLAVVDETPAPDREYLAMAAALGLEAAADGSLQPDKMGALPTGSRRAGVFAAGPSRGRYPLETQLDEAAQAMWAIHRLLDQPGDRPLLNRVKVDRRACALCLTCVRVCPSGAMQKAARRPYSNPLACTGCGACAAECPMDAIQIAGREDQRCQAEISAAVGRADGFSHYKPQLELLVFLCANSAAAALHGARLRGLALPEEARVVSLPCAGRLKASQVLDGLRKGFDGVLVVSCHPDACFSQESGDWWGRRVEYLQRILAEAGQEPGRLIHGSAAPNQPRELTALAEQALEQVRELGLNPLKTGAQVRRFLARFTLSADESYTLL